MHVLLCQLALAEAQYQSIIAGQHVKFADQKPHDDDNETHRLEVLWK